MTFRDWPWRDWRQRRGEAQALRLNDQPLTWRDLCARVDALAAGFAAQAAAATSEAFGEKDRRWDAAAVADAATALTQMSLKLISRWKYTPRLG